MQWPQTLLARLLKPKPMNFGMCIVLSLLPSHHETNKARPNGLKVFTKLVHVLLRVPALSRAKKEPKEEPIQFRGHRVFDPYPHGSTGNESKFQSNPIRRSCLTPMA